MRVRSESGEGKVTTFIWLVVIVGLVYSGWHAIPLYVDHYNLKDKMQTIARSPRGTTPDDKILDMLMKEVQTAELSAYIGKGSFVIQTSDTHRKVSVDYERETEVLPGWKRVFHFKDEVDMPLLF